MPDEPMPDEDLKLGTAADEPADQPVAAPDMKRYYYRPGTTEPELRPEFANEDAAPAETEAEPSALKGKLPEDFPGHSSLEAAGLTTYAKVRKSLDTLEEIEGIGPATAEKIREAMGESAEEEEEAQ